MIIRDFRYIIYELDQKENIFKSKTIFFIFYSSTTGKYGYQYLI